MLIFNKIKQLCKAILVGFLVSFLWMQAPTAAVEETPVKDADTAPYLKSESVEVKSADTIPSEKGARLQAVLDCIPDEVTRKNDDIQQRVAQAFGEMGNDYLERTFKLTDSPELNEAEKEFESCLKSKDLMPLREANF
jgi:hypothetical protein